MISIKIGFILLSLSLIGLVSCEEEDVKIPPTDILSFWSFEGYENNGILENIPDNISIDLYIGSIYSIGNDFEGKSHYRNYWGRFRLDGENIEFYDLRVSDLTIHNDPTLHNDNEKKYLLSLLKSYKYIVENNVLTLFYNKDSCLVFKKSDNKIYEEEYELSALYNGQNWKSDPNTVWAGMDSYSNSYYVNFKSDPVLKYSDGELYDIDILIYYPSKIASIYETATTSVHAKSYVNGDHNAIRSESNAGFLKINRVSRRFVSGEFEFHMIQNGSNEFDITQGKFKARMSSDLQWYKY